MDTAETSIAGLPALPRRVVLRIMAFVVGDASTPMSTPRSLFILSSPVSSRPPVYPKGTLRLALVHRSWRAMILESAALLQLPSTRIFGVTAQGRDGLEWAAIEKAPKLSDNDCRAILNLRLESYCFFSGKERKMVSFLRRCLSVRNLDIVNRDPERDVTTARSGGNVWTPGPLLSAMKNGVGPWATLTSLNLVLDIDEEGMPLFLEATGNCVSLESLGLYLCKKNSSVWPREDYFTGDVPYIAKQLPSLVTACLQFGKLKVSFSVMDYILNSWHLPRLQNLYTTLSEPEFSHVKPDYDLPSIGNIRCDIHSEIWRPLTVPPLPFNFSPVLSIEADSVPGLLQFEHKKLKRLVLTGTLIRHPNRHVHMSKRVLGLIGELAESEILSRVPPNPELVIPSVDDVQQGQMPWTFYLFVFLLAILTNEEHGHSLEVILTDITHAQLPLHSWDDNGQDWSNVLQSWRESSSLENQSWLTIRYAQKVNETNPRALFTRLPQEIITHIVGRVMGLGDIDDSHVDLYEIQDVLYEFGKTDRHREPSPLKMGLRLCGVCRLLRQRLLESRLFQRVLVLKNASEQEARGRTMGGMVRDEEVRFLRVENIKFYRETQVNVTRLVDQCTNLKRLDVNYCFNPDVRDWNSQYLEMKDPLLDLMANPRSSITTLILRLNIMPAAIPQLLGTLPILPALESLGLCFNEIGLAWREEDQATGAGIFQKFANLIDACIQITPKSRSARVETWCLTHMLKYWSAPRLQTLRLDAHDDIIREIAVNNLSKTAREVHCRVEPSWVSETIHFIPFDVPAVLLVLPSSVPGLLQLRYNRMEKIVIDGQIRVEEQGEPDGGPREPKFMLRYKIPISEDIRSSVEDLFWELGFPISQQTFDNIESSQMPWTFYLVLLLWIFAKDGCKRPLEIIMQGITFPQLQRHARDVDGKDWSDVLNFFMDIFEYNFQLRYI